MKLLESTSSIVYKTLLKAFRNDPWLQREVKTWLTGQGERIDIEGQPSDRTRPLISFTPLKGNTYIVDTCSLRSDFNIKVEMYLTSFSYLDMMDLWGAVERVVFDPVNDSMFQDVGVIKTTPQMQTMELLTDDYSTYGQGLIQCDLWEVR